MITRGKFSLTAILRQLARPLPPDPQSAAAASRSAMSQAAPSEPNPLAALNYQLPAPRPALQPLDCGCGCAQRLMRAAQLLQRQKEVGARLQRAVGEAAAAAAGECRGISGSAAAAGGSRSAHQRRTAAAVAQPAHHRPLPVPLTGARAPAAPCTLSRCASAAGRLCRGSERPRIGPSARRGRWAARLRGVSAASRRRRPHIFVSEHS